jgi:cysteine-rich repeat protein
VDSKLVQCEGLLLCPSGFICDNVHGRCLTEDQMLACEDREEGAPCTFGKADGVCFLGACTQSICGNNLPEPGEVCDFGDRIDGDGCRNDCRSDETCGNEILDSHVGEVCDVGAGLSHDGCAEACFLEEPSWKQPLQMKPRSLHAMAFDIERGRVVLVGGTVGEGIFSDDTWFLQEGTWTPGPGAPEGFVPRSGHSIVYDAARGRVVLFGGGRGDGTILNDTWVLSGNVWIPGPEAPPELATRMLHSMAYDAANARVVLFGGFNGDGFRNDTWFLEGESWVPGPSAPPGLTPRSGHTLAYDAGRRRTVLFGGRDIGNVHKNDTWFLQGDSWVPGPSAPPGLAPRVEHAMTYDPASGRVVLFGGVTDSGLRDDTWFLEGDSWVPGPSAPATLTPRSALAMTYDTTRKRVVLYGGSDGSSRLGDTWFLQENQWMPAEANPITERAFHAMVYDSARGRIVMFGGYDGAVYKNDTWVLAGDGWVPGPSAPPGLTPRLSHAMAYDSARARTVMFGGHDGAVYKNDTWVLAGDGWVPGPSAPPGLTPRLNHALAYDAQGGRMVLFGGKAGGVYQNDTWFFVGDIAEGDSWIPGPSPPLGLTPRGQHSMAYDGATGRVILFGGFDGSKVLGDTWFLEADGWVRVPTSSALGPRGSSAMIYDSTLGKVILFGGVIGTTQYSDTWRLEGDNWALVQGEAPSFLTPRYGHAMAYHAALGRVVLFGGFSGTVYEKDTWFFRYDGGQPDENCLLDVDDDGDGRWGCDDPDCWGRCTPECSPHMSCDLTAPHCGDKIKNPALENCRNCPEDFGGCVECGDFVCTTPKESVDNCPGDCAAI